MANKTLLQTRTDYPAVTPIDPDECLILDQQTDRPEGEQSTVATLSELIATGGRTVTTAVSYETLYADSVVNVSAASITITVGSVMRNGSRLLIRRTSAYDGDPVTITPPSGATFEGLASITLYGQYSYVELERISATVFAIKDILDSGTSATGDWWINKDILTQQGNLAGFTASTTQTVTLPRPYPNDKYVVTGEVTPLGLASAFIGYKISRSQVDIRSGHVNNTYRWQTTGRWR